MSEKEFKSPVANAMLRRTVQNDREYYVCPETGGMYLHKGDLNALLPHHESLFASEDLELSSLVKKTEKDVHGDIPCIHCGNPAMTKVTFLAESGIVLDHCEQCGSFWIDGGELRKMREYWENVEENSKKAHDPAIQVFLNFLKSLSIPFFSAILYFSAITGIRADAALDSLRGKIGGLYSSFTANFSVAGSSGQALSGKIYYQAPNKVHIKMSNGGIIASNGQYIVIYNPASGMAAKQDAGGTSGGILGLLRGYEGTVQGNRYIFRKPDTQEQIVVSVANNMLSSVQIRRETGTVTYSFSGVNVGAGISGSLFSYKPPTSVRVIENPLNR